jgi:hypothetical protein
MTSIFKLILLLSIGAGLLPHASTHPLPGGEKVG